jgi:transcriptional regulator with XRE-family HTH domain
VDVIVERSHTLKQALVDFVLDAEGELAQALEAYAAAQLRRGNGDSTQQDLIIDSFITEGKVGDKSPIDLFLASNADLSASDRKLINSWHRSFIGLFSIAQILPDGLELMNWLTAKHYIVKPNSPEKLQAISRFKPGDILLTRISPLTENDWIFSGPSTFMGKLGKPKLAVAIGNFKDNYKNHLYSDAPDLLEEAWQSVEQYYQQFVDFFGGDEITLPGYQLNKKIAEFQEIVTEKYLKAAGLDTSKSLDEMAAAAGIEEDEIQAAAKEIGVDSNAVSQILNGKNGKQKMVAPKVDLPADLRKAEQVTAISHPRWGMIFLPTYTKFTTILLADDWQSIEGAEKLVRQYLEDKNINAYIWHRLAQQYPTQLEKVLQDALQRPEFNINDDLDKLLQEFDKSLEPELPEIASVPLHLHNLFQEAITEVNKSKPKGKGKKPAAKGFQRG